MPCSNCHKNGHNARTCQSGGNIILVDDQAERIAWALYPGVGADDYNLGETYELLLDGKFKSIHDMVTQILRLGDNSLKYNFVKDKIDLIMRI